MVIDVNPNLSIDVLVLSNGPGEITTWVRPVVQALRAKFGENRDKLRISVMLSPCPHAMGQEAVVARSYPEIDRVQASEHFWPFLAVCTLFSQVLGVVVCRSGASW